MKICTIVGARPQFIKAASLSAALRRQHHEVLIHTGQHYDFEMSRVFFEELGIPVPDHNLGVGSGSHGAQTGAMLPAIEQVLLTERPDRVVVIGDTNSTLAGALAAAKLGIPIVHVEAGLRSYRRSMPEEINRVLTDHLSTWLCCPTDTAVANLAREGITRGVRNTGDILYDALHRCLPMALASPGARARVVVPDHGYAFVTLHRAENTDDRTRLATFARALPGLGLPVVFPVHPRTRHALHQAGCWQELTASPSVHLMDSLSYLDALRFTLAAAIVVTDSGGLQREAAALGVPCIVTRDETEWVESLADGRTVLAGDRLADLSAVVAELRAVAVPLAEAPLEQRIGAGARICRLLEEPPV